MDNTHTHCVYLVSDKDVLYLYSPRSPQLEKALAQKQRPNTAKNK